MYGSDRTASYKDWRYSFLDHSVLRITGPGVSLTGEWGVDYTNHVMKMHADGNAKADLINGAYNVVSITLDRVTLRGEDASQQKFLVLKKVKLPRRVPMFK
jgi:hypothetical protein